MSSRSIHLTSFILFLFIGVIISLTPGVFGEVYPNIPDSGTIKFTLTDIGDSSKISRVALMKMGDYTREGRLHQYENISFNKNTSEILWTPCNNNDCSYASFPTAGGNNGPAELILELHMINPAVDIRSCYGDPTCEHLRGGTSTKSGMLVGVYKTGKAYDISVSSLKSGIGQQYLVSEKKY